MSPVAYATFRAALDSGNLDRVMLLAREMAPLKLDDALKVVLLMRTGPEQQYDRACVRWLGRFALEVTGVSLEELQDAADALDKLPDQPDAAMTRLQKMCIQRGVG